MYRRRCNISWSVIWIGKNYYKKVEKILAILHKRWYNKKVPSEYIKNRQKILKNNKKSIDFMYPLWYYIWSATNE